MFTNNAVIDVWDDVTSDCHTKYMKSHGRVNNSWTILLEKKLNFMLFLTQKNFEDRLSFGQVTAS